MVPPFFKGPDAVGPQDVVEVDFVKGIFVPVDSIEGTISPTSSGTVIQRPTNNLEGLVNHTGGEPLFTHQVRAEYMVGSETKYPAWTHRVYFDHFCNSPPICPLKYPPGTC